MADFVGKIVVVLFSWHSQSCHAVPWLWVGFPRVRGCWWLCRGNRAKEPCRGAGRTLWRSHSENVSGLKVSKLQFLVFGGEDGQEKWEVPELGAKHKMLPDQRQSEGRSC